MKHQLPVLLTALTVPLVLSANWQEINNFESGSTDGINFFDTNHSEQYFTIGILDIVDRPFSGEGKVLATTAGFGLYNDFHVWMPMAPIAEGTDGTVYLEFAQTDGANNTAFGTIITDDPIGETTPRWGNYYALSRFNFSSFDIYDLNGYVNFGTVTDATWYKVWMHIDNQLDVLNLYVQGGDWTEQTLIYEGAIFRNEITIDPMINFMIIQAAGNLTNPTSGQYVYWDNIYVDPTGLNLGVPVVETDPPVVNPFDALVAGEWTSIANFGAGYGFANAADWTYNAHLGFIHVTNFPWLYSAGLGFLYYQTGDFETEGMIAYSVEHGWIALRSDRPNSIYVYSSGEWVDPAPKNLQKTY